MGTIIILLLPLVIVLACVGNLYCHAASLMKGHPIERIKEEVHQCDNFCPLEQISATTLLMVVVSEDWLFFTHKGADYGNIFFAMLQNVRKKRKAAGGSTITQQLAKNLYLPFTKTYSRKIIELFIALSIERHLSKEEILELYLNVIQFGPDFHGIANAAHYYFKKSPSELTFNESLTLKALIVNPIVYNPLLASDNFEKYRKKLIAFKYADGIIRKEHIPVLLKSRYNEVLDPRIGNIYEQTFRMEWLDAVRNRRLLMPNISSPIFDRLFPHQPTAGEFLDHVNACAALPTKYLYGGMMEPISRALIQRLSRRYPDHYPEDRINYLLQFEGFRACDCSGLIKSFFFGINGSCYEPFFDRNAEMLFRSSMHSGPIERLPETPGICLFMPGHTGIYLGSGDVVEATPNPEFGDGVVHTRVESRKWTHWYCCPFILYGPSEKMAENKSN